MGAAALRPPVVARQDRGVDTRPGGTAPDDPDHPHAVADPRAPLDAAALRARLLRPAGPLARLDVVDRTGSTHADLVAAARGDRAAGAGRPVGGGGPAGLPALLVAEHQVAGRGRAGRTWTVPPRAALTASVLLQPRVPPARLGWLPLLAGLAVVRALGRTGLPAGVARLKWPNDVLLAVGDRPAAGWGTDRKVAGVLAEVVPAGTRVVVGIGLNVSQTADELPVPTATSLALAAAATGVPTPGRGEVLVALVEELVDVVARWEEADGDAVAAGLAAACADVSATIGRRVRAELAGGAGDVVGTAVGLDPDGALVVRTDDARHVVVAAGDVHHLRPATGPDGPVAAPAPGPDAGV